MAFLEQIQKDSEQLGIQPSHYDIDGHLIYANPESISYFTKLLQPPTQISAREPIFAGVFVVKENEVCELALETQLSLPPSEKPLICELFSQQQALLFSSSFSSSKISLPALTYGYYDLHLKQEENQWRVRLIVSPKTAFLLPQEEKRKYWGINVQLYSLRSERNWGMGDFGDLAYLIEKSAPLGADFIGINPLHEAFPNVTELSPYSASSRRWLHTLYLDIEALPEFKATRSVKNWLAEEATQARLKALREQDCVDYQGVHALKDKALRELFAFFLRSKGAKTLARRKMFQSFVQEKGDALLFQSLFDVLDSQEHQKAPADENQIGWLGWRSEWQHLSLAEKRQLAQKYQKEVQYFSWLQWLCHEQLSQLRALCEKVGMTLGIYGDLAVSCSRGGADVWTDSEIFCQQASVGAPPDPLGPVGQNWHIPPYNPSVLKARGFQPFIDLLRANMQYFGVLRIDHIMGLYRLWLIPENKNASDGLYVKYPFDELMAILAIESQRQKCLVVGEDLGTVPDEVRWKLNELAIFSYFVLYFAKQGEMFPQGCDFPQKAFATIGTHDLPSLSSFWHCRDLELFSQVGVLQGDFLQQKYLQRLYDKQALLNSLHRDNYLAPDYAGDALSMAMHDNLNAVIHQYFAESRSQLIGVQLENLLSQEISFNLPGTCVEYANWQKKLSDTLENIFKNEHICAFLTRINQARKK